MAPEIPRLGLSMGGGRDGDNVVSEALFVDRELSQDPYRTATVTAWRDVHHEEHTFLIDERRLERPCWDLRPWMGVGPLRFGMRAQEARAALGVDAPTVTNLTIDHGYGFERRVEWEWYETAGVTAHYDGLFLLAVNVDGRIGPQVRFIIGLARGDGQGRRPCMTVCGQVSPPKRHGPAHPCAPP
ncbi:hypothetical protein [Streptomyces sp. AM6-12]|uniref:hypothetical protein n=1 Tax=Streptomyces sp. AM6-12 TaxID=3345149 RepID=UPI0037AD2190